MRHSVRGGRHASNVESTAMASMTVDDSGSAGRDARDVCHLIVAYVQMVERHGPLDFALFREMWDDAGELARVGLACGLGPGDVPL